ncbi:hypothetical protein [Rugamonas sp.]|uniref:tetratricopeptide repeat protein n=1 Tax=Rugamonas sp. TaxID=1926287 RepID=UPI0025D6920D|nr:hypothetical protein [Rugamonas sp.]
MKPHHLLPCLACVLLLSACADGGGLRADGHPAVALDRALADADRAVSAGQTDQAQTILKNAATTYPADKTPWLHLAQIKFDRASYGEAIMNALEALQRDPNDKLGNSIVAVSGLRLSTKALADLSQQNNLNGSLRSEAKDLARLLRASLGEDVLVPTGAAPTARQAASAKKSPPRAAHGREAPPAGGDDAFGGLK